MSPANQRKGMPGLFGKRICILYIYIYIYIYIIYIYISISISISKLLYIILNYITLFLYISPIRKTMINHEDSEVFFVQTHWVARPQISVPGIWWPIGSFNPFSDTSIRHAIWNCWIVWSTFQVMNWQFWESGIWLYLFGRLILIFEW